MTDLKNITNIYFIGIGGIGMSALAKYFLSKSITVNGYDKTATTLTKQMENEGINIHYSDDIELLDKKAQLVVYTPAVPNDHRELNYFRKNNYEIVKRSDVLGAVTANCFNICVAGTHGKTTVSTMIAHILRNSGYGCNAFLGGVSVNYDTNFWSNEKNVCVAEADEYDRSFLKLSPDVAVITSMDPDHLDIYGSVEVMQDAFVEFAKKIKPGGLLISKFGLKRSKDLGVPGLPQKAGKNISYSLQNDSADAYATNITMKHGSYEFQVMMKDWMIDNVELNMGGMHNVENAVAAIVVARHLGIESAKIRKAVQEFKGIKRRFEYIISPAHAGGEVKGVIFIDDYAHHPVELKALIMGAKNLFPGKKSTVVFQPHLFTRTRDLAKEFAQALDLADEVILLPVYPARELPIEGVTSKMILDEMKNDHKQILTREELMDWVKMNPVELLITAGAGDIDTTIVPLKAILENKK